LTLRDRDLSLLDSMLSELEHREPLSGYFADARDAFKGMRSRLAGRGENATLSADQRRWVEDVSEKVDAAATPGKSASEVPRGKEVELAFKKGPLAPPGRAQS
jgi:hypothetical protein